MRVFVRQLLAFVVAVVLISAAEEINTDGLPMLAWQRFVNSILVVFALRIYAAWGYPGPFFASETRKADIA